MRTMFKTIQHRRRGVVQQSLIAAVRLILASVRDTISRMLPASLVLT
jgi:hypothetical protein